MALYRFRITFEDDNEVVRIIEIKSNQTLEDFHLALLKSVEFDTKHDAICYVSDDYWKKGDKYVYLPSGEGDDTPLFAETKLHKLINDPHQKLLYIYDLNQEWTFHIELTGISMNENPKLTYPHLAKSEGKAPKQYIVHRKIGVDLEDDEFDYLTKNLLGGEIAEEMLGEHIDEGDVAEDALQEGDEEEDVADEEEGGDDEIFSDSEDDFT